MPKKKKNNKVKSQSQSKSVAGKGAGGGGTGSADHKAKPESNVGLPRPHLEHRGGLVLVLGLSDSEGDTLKRKALEDPLVSTLDPPLVATRGTHITLIGVGAIDLESDVTTIKPM